MAANGLFRYTSGAAFPLFTIQSMSMCPVVLLSVLTSTSVQQIGYRVGYLASRIYIDCTVTDSMGPIQIWPSN